MKVVVASKNPVKIAAAEAAFRIQYPDTAFEFETTTAESGVDDQPFSDDDTRAGAINRAPDACERCPDADFWMGVEGGVDTFNQQLMAFAWMAVVGPGGRTGTARTVALPLPPPVKTRVEEGLELGKANDEVFGTENSKHGSGAFGLLTGGRYTRESIYTETLVIALVPFTNELYE